MRLLFVGFALSFCALLWVAFSVARHIQRHKRSALPEPENFATPAENHASRHRPARIK
jgi:hypothetical protein